MKISNIRVLGDKIEMWETFEDHIEILDLTYEQFEWATNTDVGKQKLVKLNKDNDFKKKYAELKEYWGYRIEMLSPKLEAYSKAHGDFKSIAPKNKYAIEQEKNMKSTYKGIEEKICTT